MAKQNRTNRQDGAVQMLLSLADHTTGNFLSGVTGRLRVKVIRLTVYDHCPTNHITD